MKAAITSVMEQTNEKSEKNTLQFYIQNTYQLISGQVDRESATETVELGLIPSRVKPKTIKIGIHSFPA